MKDYKITIITPSNNRAHTLERVYNSIVKQSFRDLKWLVLDDGSTDNTKELIDELKSRNEIDIEYHYHENQKKYLTIQSGIKNFVNTEFFIIMDSDDEFFEESISLFYKEAEKIKDHPDIGSVVGNTLDSNGSFVGTTFPKSPLDIYIFEMRHKYNVKGGKLSIIQTRKYKEFDYQLDYYKGKGYVPDDVWQNIFDQKYKSRFINEIMKIYHLDIGDQASLSNARYTKKSAFGIKESYKTALNTYANRLFKYPIVLSKKMVGYLYFGLNNNDSMIQLFNGLRARRMKLLFVLLFLPSLGYYLLKPLKD